VWRPLQGRVRSAPGAGVWRGDWSLVLEGVQRSDAALYECILPDRRTLSTVWLRVGESQGLDDAWKTLCFEQLLTFPEVSEKILPGTPVFRLHNRSIPEMEPCRPHLGFHSGTTCRILAQIAQNGQLMSRLWLKLKKHESFPDSLCFVEQRE